MVNWEMLADDAAEKVWDQNLISFSDYSLFQTFRWGEYKRSFGWKPCRWIAYKNEGKIVAMMQGMLRSYPSGIGIVWSPGGPVGDISAWNAELNKAIMRTTGLKRIYCRFSSHRELNARDALILKSHGWFRSYHTLGSGMSMWLDLNKGEVQLRSELSGNWRHNLQRASKYNLSIQRWLDPDSDDMASLYSSMQSYKDVAVQYTKKEIEKIFENMGHKIILYRCNDSNGALVSIRGCAVEGSKGWDLFAATSAEGRRMYASYSLFWAMIQYCRAIGVKYYDMGGIDPIKARGVYDFKKGTGAVPIEYLGEWDWATPGWLRWVGNWAVWKRDGQL